jgi:hypothetical protein
MAKIRKPREGESGLLDQVRIAAQQVDAEPGGKLGWMVRFAREDPASWLPGDRDAHGWRLLSFPRPIAPNEVRETGIHPLAPQDVIALHSEIREMLRAIVGGPENRGRGIEIPTDGLKVSLIRASGPGKKPAIFGFSHGGPFRTMLFQKLAELVVANDRLIACPFCGEPFLALRKQKFCGPKCAERWHNREKLAKRKEVGR